MILPRVQIWIIRHFLQGYAKLLHIKVLRYLDWKSDIDGMLTTLPLLSLLDVL